MPIVKPQKWPDCSFVCFCFVSVCLSVNLIACLFLFFLSSSVFLKLFLGRNGIESPTDYTADKKAIRIALFTDILHLHYNETERECEAI